jgi:spire
VCTQTKIKLKKKKIVLMMEKVKENKKLPDTKISQNNTTSEKTASVKPPNGKIQSCLEFCSDKDNCLSLNDILRSFNAPLSEEQAWSLIYQSVLLYRNYIRIEFIDKHTKKDATQKSSHRIKVPKSTKNLNVHKDGTVHITDSGKLLFLLKYY